MSAAPLHLFYAEPDPDRWLPGDRWPRALVRRLVRGAPQPGGMMRYFLNLRAGLDALGAAYRVNDLRSLRRHPDAVASVIGKHDVVATIPADHPVAFGPAVPSHPAEQPELFRRPNLRLTVLSSAWHEALYRAAGAARTAVWAAGIDTAHWCPPAVAPAASPVHVLLYDKIRWERDAAEPALLAPVRAELARRGCTVHTLRYGAYEEADFRALLGHVHAMVFLCEHETQGFAYLQALSAGVPLLAWDRGGAWRDPQAAALGVDFGSVSSVPYWDERCGVKFADAAGFPGALDRLLDGLAARRFAPRAFIEENFRLADCARRYVDLIARAAS